MAQRVKRALASDDRRSTGIRRSGCLPCAFQREESVLSLYDCQSAVQVGGRPRLLLASCSATRRSRDEQLGRAFDGSTRLLRVRGCVARSRFRILEYSSSSANSLYSDTGSDLDRHRSKRVLAPHGSQYRWVARQGGSWRVAEFRTGGDSRKPGSEAGGCNGAAPRALPDASTLWRPIV